MACNIGGNRGEMLEAFPLRYLFPPAHHIRIRFLSSRSCAPLSLNGLQSTTGLHQLRASFLTLLLQPPNCVDFTCTSGSAISPPPTLAFGETPSLENCCTVSAKACYSLPHARCMRTGSQLSADSTLPCMLHFGYCCRRHTG
jgi:hypothetical protein